jgi:uncharacterized protein
VDEVTGIETEGARLIPARRGVAAHVRSGQTLQVVNSLGKQVVDTWAFNAADLGEFMSMGHSRTAILRLTPRVGDTLVTNRRRAIMTLIADTTPGVHDTLIAACDIHRYRQLGVRDYHNNCTDNLEAALAAIGLSAPEVPSPLNLFMNVPIGRDGSLAFLPPVSECGQYVTFRAEMDIVVVLSACPQDIMPVNGVSPTDAHFLISE